MTPIEDAARADGVRRVALEGAVTDVLHEWNGDASACYLVADAIMARFHVTPRKEQS